MSDRAEVAEEAFRMLVDALQDEKHRATLMDIWEGLTKVLKEIEDCIEDERCRLGGPDARVVPQS